MTDQDKLDQITKDLELYVELYGNGNTDFDKNEVQLQELAERLPYEFELDKAALEEWRKLLKSYDTGLQDDQVEHFKEIEWRWFEVLSLHGIETNWI